MAETTPAKAPGISQDKMDGSFTGLYEAFKANIKYYKDGVDDATKAWGVTPTDPSLTLNMQAAQGDLGTVTRGVGSLISALVSLQSEITQKIK